MNTFQYSKENIDLSSLSGNKVKKILNELCELRGLKSIEELSNHIGRSKQAVYQWVERGKIPPNVVKKNFPEVNINYILTGVGELTTHETSAVLDAINASAYNAQEEYLYMVKSAIKLLQEYVESVERSNRP